MLDTPTSQEVRLEGVPADAWVKLNPDAVGFYRVAYGAEELARLCAAVKDMSLTHLDRKCSFFLVRC